MHDSMLFSTCFKAVRCFLHNQLSSRTHTTGLNLFFSATTIPRWWSAILMFETIFSFSPSKADATTFKEGFIMTLSLCQTGHSRTQFYFHLVDCRNSLVNENLRGNQRLVLFMFFFFEIFHNHQLACVESERTAAGRWCLTVAVRATSLFLSIWNLESVAIVILYQYF